MILEKLVERSSSLVQTGAEPKRQVEIGEAFLKAADKLIKADDLDSETALTELLLHHKNVLLEYLQSQPNDERSRRLTGKLWKPPTSPCSTTSIRCASTGGPTSARSSTF